MKQALVLISAILIFVIPSASFAGDCGDVNSTGLVDLLDITYLINYLYKGGPEPDCETVYGGVFCGDVNNNRLLDLLDITYIINYLYKDGPIPQCGCGILIDIDGNEYKTMVIGEQCWGKENLKATHYRNGDPVPNVTDGEEWAGLFTGAYCDYINDPANVATYGRLYNWFAVIDSRNIAPNGWHVPTDAEWQTLVDYLGGDAVAGGKLKEAGTMHWNSPNTGATNESGFTAFPGGYRGFDGDYGNMGNFGYFWSSTESYDGYVWYRYLYYLHSRAGHTSNASERDGLSIRCVRD